MPVSASARCLILRGGQAMILPATLATPQELAIGVPDVEDLCDKVAATYLKRRTAYLTDDAHAELISFLLLAAWTEAGRYAPKDAGSNLIRYLSQRLAWRCTDWYRTTYGRGPRIRPILLSLDEQREAELLEPDVA